MSYFAKELIPAQSEQPGERDPRPLEVAVEKNGRYLFVRGFVTAWKTLDVSMDLDEPGEAERAVDLLEKMHEQARNYVLHYRQPDADPFKV